MNEVFQGRSNVFLEQPVVSMIRSRFNLLLLIASFLSMAVPVVQAAPESELWERWAVHDTASEKVIDHSAWTQLLRRFVVPSNDGVNRFAYAKFRKPHRFQLDEYIRRLSNIPISEYNREQQRAYWINLYNALTIAVIDRNFPVQSIRDIASGFISRGPWDLELIEIEGEALTLNDIEHRILRPIWKDARIHYAVNCASIGCPNLQDQAFTADNTESLLQQAAIEFINHPRGAKVVDDELQVSSIYIWFIEDFGGDDQSVIAHLKRYAKGDLLSALNQVDEIDNHRYDWSINSVSKPEKRRSSRSRGS